MTQPFTDEFNTDEFDMMTQTDLTKDLNDNFDKTTQTDHTEEFDIDDFTALKHVQLNKYSFKKPPNILEKTQVTLQRFQECTLVFLKKEKAHRLRDNLHKWKLTYRRLRVTYAAIAYVCKERTQHSIRMAFWSWLKITLVDMTQTKETVLPERPTVENIADALFELLDDATQTSSSRQWVPLVPLIKDMNGTNEDIDEALQHWIDIGVMEFETCISFHPSHL